MSKTQERLEQACIIPVLRARNSLDAHHLVDAILAGGVSTFEVTMTIPGAVDLIAELSREYGKRILLGSGTVMTTDQAQATIDAGAEFVVSPCFDPDIIAVTKKLETLSIAGALTPTEIVAAWRAGADYVKVFPCSAVGGASYLKALLAPFPELRLIPTGGVTLSNAAEFLRSGARALGVGSDLVNQGAVADGQTTIVTQIARQYVEVVEAHRSLVSHQP